MADSTGKAHDYCPDCGKTVPGTVTYYDMSSTECTKEFTCVCGHVKTTHNIPKR